MMVYLDTSSLVKLYIKERHSTNVIDIVSEASAVLTSIVAYAESRSAFAKQHRDRQLTKKELSLTKKIFDEDWKRFMVVGINDEIAFLAGDLAEKHALKGFDSLHLASYLSIKGKTKREIKFSSFDDSLNKAAVKETF